MPKSKTKTFLFKDKKPWPINRKARRGEWARRGKKGKDAKWDASILSIPVLFPIVKDVDARGIAVYRRLA